MNDKDQIYSQYKKLVLEQTLDRNDQGSAKQTLDRTGTKCECGGTFRETVITDDLDGTLHCSDCNKKVRRYTSDD